MTTGLVVTHTEFMRPRVRPNSLQQPTAGALRSAVHSRSASARRRLSSKSRWAEGLKGDLVSDLRLVPAVVTDSVGVAALIQESFVRQVEVRSTPVPRPRTHPQHQELDVGTRACARPHLGRRRRTPHRPPSRREVVCGEVLGCPPEPAVQVSFRTEGSVESDCGNAAVIDDVVVLIIRG
jgi:hypothetical protein